MNDDTKNTELPDEIRLVAELARLRHIERSVLDLASEWSETAGSRLARANRLGFCKAGEVMAAEAGIFRECVRDLNGIFERDFPAEAARHIADIHAGR